ncbi:MAG: hypothetical protein U0V70_11510 [Terriglobia bacterium]
MTDVLSKSQAGSIDLSGGLILGMVLFFPVAGLSADDKPKNPYKGAPDVVHESDKGKQDVLFTKVKTKPNKAEREFLFREMGIPKNKWKDYVAEYRMPISLGGSNTFSNIEALPKAKAKIKQKVQKELERQVSKKEISLSEAQTRIFNWEVDPLAKGK